MEEGGKRRRPHPDGKTKMTIKYKENTDDALEPQKINNVVIPMQHADTLKDMHTKECAGYNGPEMITQGMDEMAKLVEPHPESSSLAVPGKLKMTARFPITIVRRSLH